MDDRTYIRLHDGMPDHPKVVGLSHAAFRLYVECMCWSSRHLTDGVVPAAAMRRMGGYSAQAVRELATATLLEESGGPVWAVHDYTEHQRTAALVASFKEAKRSSGVTGNHERWHVRRKVVDPSCELCAIGDASQVRSGSDRKSDRKHHRESSPETETETDKKTKTIGQTASDHDPDFAAFWAAWPRKVGKGHARKAWRSAVLGRRAEPKDIIAAAEQFAAAIRAARTEPQFIPHPATWLNGERYADETHAPDPGGDPDDDFWGR